MSFTARQQGVFRPLVEEAWQVVCTHREGASQGRCKPSKRCGECAYCGWYMEELQEAAAVSSTRDLDVRRDFEKVMAHFGAIAGNLYWVNRAFGGDVRRLLHNVHEVCRDRDFSEPYIRGVAAKALSLDEPPALESLSYEQLAQVLSALKSKARRFRDWKNPVAVAAGADPDWTV